MEKEEGKETLSMQDLVKIQDDIRKVIDINKPDNELTSDQLVKKILYKTTDDILEKNMGKDFMKILKEKRNHEDKIELLRSNIKEMEVLGREIEKLFTLQGAVLSCHFDHSNENFYRQNIDRMTTETIENKDLSNSERSESSKKILDLVNVYREKIIGDLRTQQSQIFNLLSGFENRLKKTPFEFYKNDDDFIKIHSSLSKWLDLSWKSNKSREKVVECINEHLDADEIIPRHILDAGGDASGNIPAENMFRIMERVTTITQEAAQLEKDIQVEKTGLSEELFGKQEEYTEPEMDNALVKEITPSESDKKMGTKTKWIIVIVLSIIALSVGVWTAIGVFVLGSIIIGLLSK